MTLLCQSAADDNAAILLDATEQDALFETDRRADARKVHAHLESLSPAEANAAVAALDDAQLASVLADVEAPGVLGRGGLSYDERRGFVGMLGRKLVGEQLGRVARLSQNAEDKVGYVRTFLDESASTDPAERNALLAALRQPDGALAPQDRPAARLVERSLVPQGVSQEDRAEARQDIFGELRGRGVHVLTRDQWGAKAPQQDATADWAYDSVAIHHAGNSYSCDDDGVLAMRRAEATDLANFGQISYHYAIDCKGVVYEGADIRQRGAHVEGGNSGVIGLVLLGDLTGRGEAAAHGPGVLDVGSRQGVLAGVKEAGFVAKDMVDVRHDHVTSQQALSARVLVDVLKDTFDIETIGGHRDYAHALGSSRACPGAEGLELVNGLRREFALAEP